MAVISVSYPSEEVLRSVTFPDEFALPQMLLVWQAKWRDEPEQPVAEPTADELAQFFLKLVVDYIGKTAEAEMRRQAEEGAEQQVASARAGLTDLLVYE